jgi:amidase
VTSLRESSALEQAAAVRRRDVSVEELLRDYLATIEARQPELQAFTQLDPARALATARRLDARARRDEPRGPLWGLPTAMKDVHLARGTFTRLGSRAFRWLWSPVDDVTTRAVRRAGMVLVGKLATSELALLPWVETDLQPPTRNPWDPELTAGGSSGGSAAALAAGLLPVAPASDGAGSIRIPATFCGLVGHKPTRGLVPNPFARFERLGLSVVGPHARSVDDAAALLDVLVDGGDFLESVRRPPPRLRVRFTTESTVARTEPDVARAVSKVTAALAALGHEVEEGGGLGGSVDEYLPLFARAAAELFVPSERRLQPTTRWLRELGRGVTVEAARARLRELAARVDAWLGAADLWVTPTVACAPPRVGATADLGPAARFAVAAPLGAFTAAFNLSGHPATSIPVWLDGRRLPLGVQLIGPRAADARVLATARVVLEALGTPLAPIADQAASSAGTSASAQAWSGTKPSPPGTR